MTHLSLAQAPECYGQRPSVVAARCQGCPWRKKCCQKFSRGYSVRFLSQARLATKSVGSSEEEISVFGARNLDVVLLATVFSFGKTLTARSSKNGYLRTYRDDRGRKVLGILRADVRKLQVDFFQADEAMAQTVGAKPIEDQRGIKWRLTLDPSDPKKARQKVKNMLLGVMLQRASRCTKATR